MRVAERGLAEDDPGAFASYPAESTGLCWTWDQTYCVCGEVYDSHAACALAEVTVGYIGRGQSSVDVFDERKSRSKVGRGPTRRTQV
jgi:hypothetical protein